MTKQNTTNMAVGLILAITMFAVLSVVITFAFNISLSQLKHGAPIWQNTQGGLIGGIIGCLGGLFGTLIGGLSGLYKYKWAFRAQIIGLFTTGFFGLTTLISGITLQLINQPKQVWYPLILSGIILTTLGFLMIPAIFKRQHMHENQKMNALDSLS